MKKLLNSLKQDFQILKGKIPVSVSDLNYKDHKLFIGIMFGVIGFLIGKEYYISALAIQGVYAFRWFHLGNQKYFHYTFALLAFLALGWQSGIYYPLLIGSVLFLLNKLKKTGKHVFWFEMGAGIPYLFLI